MLLRFTPGLSPLRFGAVAVARLPEPLSQPEFRRIDADATSLLTKDRIKRSFQILEQKKETKEFLSAEEEDVIKRQLYCLQERLFVLPISALKERRIKLQKLKEAYLTKLATMKPVKRVQKFEKQKKKKLTSEESELKAIRAPYYEARIQYWNKLQAEMKNLKTKPVKLPLEIRIEKVYEPNFTRYCQLRNMLIEVNTGLVGRFAKQFPLYELKREDLFQEGSIGFIRALDGWDPYRPNKIGALAGWWIRQAMQRACAKDTHIPDDQFTNAALYYRTLRKLSDGKFEPEFDDVTGKVKADRKKEKKKLPVGWDKLPEALKALSSKNISIYQPLSQHTDGNSTLSDILAVDESKSIPTEAMDNRSRVTKLFSKFPLRGRLVLMLSNGIKEGNHLPPTVTLRMLEKVFPQKLTEKEPKIEHSISEVKQSKRPVLAPLAWPSTPLVEILKDVNPSIMEKPFKIEDFKAEGSPYHDLDPVKAEAVLHYVTRLQKLFEHFGQKLSQQEISHYLCMSRANVQLIYAKAIAKIKPVPPPTETAQPLSPSLLSSDQLLKLSCKTKTKPGLLQGRRSVP